MCFVIFSNPGIRQIEGMEATTPTLKNSFRVCMSEKSRKNPHTQCSFSAVNGEYCQRHSKNPRPFRKPSLDETTVIVSRSDIAAAKKIQRFWRFWHPFMQYRTQGPAMHCPETATNQTELFTMENIKTIPPIYFVSIWDERKNIWAFDIRTVVHTMTTGVPSNNPYTRDAYTARAQDILHARINWLRYRKFQIKHVNTDILTEEQCWNQRVLDIFLKIESLGYYVSCDWYHSLSRDAHIEFYRHLYHLWEWRLGLTISQKEAIVGTHSIFRFQPSESPPKRLAWWARHNIDLMERFITQGVDKDNRKLGAMYVLMALARVSRAVAESMPWLLE